MVVPPDDDHLRHVIDTMAWYVLDGGCAFKQAIMERGRGNPLFNFFLAWIKGAHILCLAALFFCSGEFYMHR